MATDSFVVEANRTVVGLAVRVPGGYRFFSSHPDYFELEARTFARAKELARVVGEITKARKEAGGPDRTTRH